MSFLYQQLETELRQGIESGRYQVGERLPSIRSLCESKKFAKATVIHAYTRLEAAGYIEARGRTGYFVRLRQLQEHKAIAAVVPDSPEPVNLPAVMQDIMAQGAAFDICPSQGRGRTREPGLIQLNRSLGRALRENSEAGHFYYDEPAGLSGFREQVSERYRRLGCHFSPQQVVITAGCQHALGLALGACCQPGDVVAVETPGFYGVLQLLESLGLKVLEIPQDPVHGMDTVMLEMLLQRWQIKACVVTPGFSTPMGSLLSDDRRKHLLRLADQHDFTVIEDDIYGDLGFFQRPSPLKSLDTEGRVILCGSLSKSLSRELRLGWVVSAEYQDDFVRSKLIHLLATSNYQQQGVSDFLSSGAYDLHLRRFRPRLQQQRDQLLQSLSEEWERLGEVSITKPNGGLSLWVSLNEQFDMSAVYLKARQEGIIITPGTLFSVSSRFNNCLRLSFAHEWNSSRRQALQRLGEIIEQVNN